jgi:undecaprenyl-diphosphatase
MKLDAELLAQRALWAGQHALPIFSAMLALLLVATFACWWALRRYTVLRRRWTLSPPLSMGLGSAVGFAVILVAAAVFNELAGQLDLGGALERADRVLSNALLTGVPPLALQVFAGFTRLGDTATLTGLCIAVAIALVVLDRRLLALGWVMAVAGNGLLNLTLKQIFGRDRPLQPDGVVLEQGFSFPSGHSSGSVVAFGMLAYVALQLLPARWHLPTVLAAVALAFTVGASRIFLRVHFASDVMAGFASGAAWLAMCVTSIELARSCCRRTV